MATSTKELYEQALTLDEHDRAALANLILESLAASDPDAEEAWSNEIKRRVAELDSGTVETIPWSVVRSRLSSKLDSVG